MDSIESYGYGINGPEEIKSWKPQIYIDKYHIYIWLYHYNFQRVRGDGTCLNFKSSYFTTHGHWMLALPFQTKDHFN